MNSFLHQETNITNPELGKLSKEAINHLKNQSNIQNAAIKPAPSAVILEHCKELLDNHSLRKPSAWGKEPLLSVDDVKLLRHIVESNERYQCLKAEDSALLKEILVSHMCEVESHQKFLWRFLKMLQNKRKNALKKKVIDMGERTNPKRVNSDSVVSKRKQAAENSRSLSSRIRKETEYAPNLKSFSKPRKKIKKIKYRSFFTCMEFKACIAVSWEIAVITHTKREFEMKIRIVEEFELYCCGEMPSEGSIATCLESDGWKELNGNEDPVASQKLLKSQTQETDKESEYVTRSHSTKSAGIDYEDSKLISPQIPKSNRTEQMKNSMVFLTHVILFAVLVLSVKMFDFQCVG